MFLIIIVEHGPSWQQNGSSCGGRSMRQLSTVFTVRKQRDRQAGAHMSSSFSDCVWGCD